MSVALAENGLGHFGHFAGSKPFRQPMVVAHLCKAMAGVFLYFHCVGDATHHCFRESGVDHCFFFFFLSFFCFFFFLLLIFSVSFLLSIFCFFFFFLDLVLFLFYFLFLVF